MSEGTLRAVDTPEEQLIRDEQIELVRRAMSTLSQKDRDIARSYYLDGASYDELIEHARLVVQGDFVSAVARKTEYSLSVCNISSLWYSFLPQ